MKSEKLEAVISWALNHGTHIDSSVRFVVAKNGEASAIATSKINDQRTLISVPRPIFLTAENAEQHFNVKTGSSNRSNELLKIYLSKLMFERNFVDRKLFEPYLDILPLPNRIFSPYFWTSDDFAALQGTDLALSVKRNFRSLLGAWYVAGTSANSLRSEDRQFYSAASKDPNFNFHQALKRSEELHWQSFEAFLWAHFILTSRGFPSIIYEDSPRDVNEAFLLPVIDLLNHANGKKVKWSFSKGENKVNFSTTEMLTSEEELFNNYGDKSNEELLLNYGFCLNNNTFDVGHLALRFPQEVLKEIEKFGIKLDPSDITTDSVNFRLQMNGSIPQSLIRVFAYLNKLTSETYLTNRAVLEGLEQLNGILKQKLQFVKGQKLNSMKSQEAIRFAKTYLQGQKTIYQQTYDAIPKLEKGLLKAMKPTSFKTILKQDKQFFNSLLISFGVTDYEDIPKKGFLKQCILLWLVRAANERLNGKIGIEIPHFITECIQQVADNIVVEKSDVEEYVDFYKSCFPRLSQQVPEVFAAGNWGIKQFILAGTVFDRLVWIRPSSQEPLFIKPEAYESS
ncbi:LAMI_0D13322g1_1 [Lachancea mirantina]|uniref:LAMI_0D13322g1_1 n=1 Tax=Lachancea mirantina TaxID=1230905 RepID=A0A1G4JGC4_9SACH|nr:LAMI_0D13322g1_1 [Lachancea mirantina]